MLRAALCDIAIGANMMLQVPEDSRSVLARYAQEVKRVAEAALAVHVDAFAESEIGQTSI